MIKNLPSKIKLPNYDLTVNFETLSLEETEQLDTDIRYGAFDHSSYDILIIKTNPEFDKYSYILFLTAVLAYCQDIKLSISRCNTLAFFLYYLFTRNDLKANCNLLKQNKVSNFSIDLPLFAIDVIIDDSYKESVGCLSIKDNCIKINKSVNPKVKPVILTHELIEWGNSIYVLGLSHHTIQSLAELLTYVIINNDFVS